MNIGIIGCGWLGKPLANKLMKKHSVTCHLRQDTPESFWNNELFIIAISTKDDYLNSLLSFLDKMNPEASIILCSSTSVYKEYDENVNEQTPITAASLQKEAEDLVQADPRDSLILRLGGLMGEDRIAGKWKSTSIFTDSPVNYIHRDDVIAIILRLIDKNISTGIFNLVAPLHPLRSEVHKKNSEHFGFQLGDFNGISHRIVDGNKIIQELGYQFIHSDPLMFWN